MAIDKEKKSNRLLASRRYTHESFTDAQESFTEVLDLGASEVYTQTHKITSSGLPFSGSSQQGQFHVVGGDNISIRFMQDHIRVSIVDESQKTGFDFTPFMGSILEYMMDQKMNITPLPEIKLKKDIAEASSVFGRTAYYNPELKEVVLYTEGRHPKDILRSFVHEMVHHLQNLEGRLQNYGTTNTNEDDALVEIEKEAYLLGNITFRNWEDKIKNQ